MHASKLILICRSNANSEFECTRQGYYRNPSDCSQFYRCVKFDQYIDDYTVFEYECPSGLVFDDRWEVCAWPSAAPPCDGSSEIFPVPRQKNVCAGEGYFADPENCRWFFACRDYYGNETYTQYEFRCPFGLGYDEDNGICNWPWLVESCGEIDLEQQIYQSSQSIQPVPISQVSGGLFDNQGQGRGKDLQNSEDYHQTVGRGSNAKCRNCGASSQIAIKGSGVYDPQRGLIIGHDTAEVYGSNGGFIYQQHSEPKSAEFSYDSSGRGSSTYQSREPTSAFGSREHASGYGGYSGGAHDFFTQPGSGKTSLSSQSSKIDNLNEASKHETRRKEFERVNFELGTKPQSGHVNKKETMKAPSRNYGEHQSHPINNSNPQGSDELSSSYLPPNRAGTGKYSPSSPNERSRVKSQLQNGGRKTFYSSERKKVESEMTHTKSLNSENQSISSYSYPEPDVPFNPKNVQNKIKPASSYVLIEPELTTYQVPPPRYGLDIIEAPKTPFHQYDLSSGQETQSTLNEEYQFSFESERDKYNQEKRGHSSLFIKVDDIRDAKKEGDVRGYTYQKPAVPFKPVSQSYGSDDESGESKSDHLNAYSPESHFQFPATSRPTVQYIQPTSKFSGQAQNSKIDYESDREKYDSYSSTGASSTSRPASQNTRLITKISGQKSGFKEDYSSTSERKESSSSQGYQAVTPSYERRPSTTIEPVTSDLSNSGYTYQQPSNQFNPFSLPSKENTDDRRQMSANYESNRFITESSSRFDNSDESNNQGFSHFKLTPTENKDSRDNQKQEIQQNQRQGHNYRTPIKSSNRLTTTEDLHTNRRATSKAQRQPSIKPISVSSFNSQTPTHHFGQQSTGNNQRQFKSENEKHIPKSQGALIDSSVKDDKNDETYREIPHHFSNAAPTTNSRESSVAVSNDEKRYSQFEHSTQEQPSKSGYQYNQPSSGKEFNPFQGSELTKEYRISNRGSKISQSNERSRGAADKSSLSATNGSLKSSKTYQRPVVRDYNKQSNSQQSTDSIKLSQSEGSYSSFSSSKQNIRDQTRGDKLMSGHSHFGLSSHQTVNDNDRKSKQQYSFGKADQSSGSNLQSTKRQKSQENRDDGYHYNTPSHSFEPFSAPSIQRSKGREQTQVSSETVSSHDKQGAFRHFGLTNKKSSSLPSTSLHGISKSSSQYTGSTAVKQRGETGRLRVQSKRPGSSLYPGRPSTNKETKYSGSQTADDILPSSDSFSDTPSSRRIETYSNSYVNLEDAITSHFGSVSEFNQESVKETQKFKKPVPADINTGIFSSSSSSAAKDSNSYGINQYLSSSALSGNGRVSDFGKFKNEQESKSSTTKQKTNDAQESEGYKYDPPQLSFNPFSSILDKNDQNNEPQPVQKSEIRIGHFGQQNDDHNDKETLDESGYEKKQDILSSSSGSYSDRGSDRGHLTHTGKLKEHGYSHFGISGSSEASKELSNKNRGTSNSEYSSGSSLDASFENSRFSNQGLKKSSHNDSVKKSSSRQAQQAQRPVGDYQNRAIVHSLKGSGEKLPITTSQSHFSQGTGSNQNRNFDSTGSYPVSNNGNPPSERYSVEEINTQNNLQKYDSSKQNSGRNLASSYFGRISSTSNSEQTKFVGSVSAENFRDGSSQSSYKYDSPSESSDHKSTGKLSSSAGSGSFAENFNEPKFHSHQTSSAHFKSSESPSYNSNRNTKKLKSQSSQLGLEHFKSVGTQNNTPGNKKSKIKESQLASDQFNRAGSQSYAHSEHKSKTQVSQVATKQLPRQGSSFGTASVSDHLGIQLSESGSQKYNVPSGSFSHETPSSGFTSSKSSKLKKTNNLDFQSSTPNTSPYGNKFAYPKSLGVRVPVNDGPSVVAKLAGYKTTTSGRVLQRFGPGGFRDFDDTLGPEVCERAGLFRHPDSCDKFYECYWDRWVEKFTLHVFDCPVTIVYDSGITACNWPFNGPPCTDKRHA